MPDELPRPTALPPDIGDALARVRPGSGARPQVAWFASVASTNDVASRLAEGGAPHLTTVVAEEQTAGRGRLGRTWFSPPGAGLYVSFIVRLLGGAPSASLPLVSLTAGVAFAEAVRLCAHLPVTIKWPNDLVVERRKLAGILTEASGGEGFEHVIVGFGLNLRPAAYPPEIADRATSIEAELGRPLDRGMVLVQCLDSFALWMDALLAGKGDAILERWRSLAPSARGSRIAWVSTAGLQEGVTDGIDDDGALLVRTTGGIQRIIAGEVKWL